MVVVHQGRCTDSGYISRSILLYSVEGRSVGIKDKGPGILVGRDDRCATGAVLCKAGAVSVLRPRRINSTIFVRTEGTMYNQFGIPDSRRRSYRTRCRFSIQGSRIADDCAELTGIAYITMRLIIIVAPLVCIIEIECALRYARCMVIYQCHFRLFIHLHLHTRQTGGTLRELHITGEEMNLEVRRQRKHETTGIEHQFQCTLSTEHITRHFTQIDYYRTEFSTTIDLIYLLVFFRIIVLAHPCILGIRHLVHKEHSRFAVFAYHLDIIGISIDGT